jgi:hypothetical protein
MEILEPHRVAVVVVHVTAALQVGEPVVTAPTVM